jgi:uncharacterized protein (TIGR02271 family)
MTEHIVAVYKTEADATAAARSLESLGIPPTAIRQYAEAVPAKTEPVEHTSTHTSGGGFWAWLFGDESMTETTRSMYTDDIYDRRVSAGNVVLSLTVDDTKIHETISALEAHNPVDIDEGSEELSQTGAGIPPPAGLGTGVGAIPTGEVAQPGVTSSYSSGRVAPAAPPEVASGSVTPAPATAGKGEEVIPLSEEQLDVGKRTVDRGTTRIRRYVVEKPVEQDVKLRGERVTVERRTPIGAEAAPGAGAFEERVVEVRETAEEPVVAKTAHVVEEVVVGREATERTETVKDTVRREEVDVAKDGAVKP